MPKSPAIGISRETFNRLQADYRERWGVSLIAVRPDGRRVLAAGRCARCRSRECQPASLHVVLECLRWGECTIYDRQPGRLRWGVPLLYNEKLLGGLVACIEEEAALPDDEAPSLDLRQATVNLRHLAEQANCTNAALLARRRTEYEEERRRAEAIHETKTDEAAGILELYLREEPELLSTIRQGRRPEAIRILNRILVQIYHQGQGRLHLLKSFVLELVVAMSRAAAEGGGPPEAALGANYTSLAQLGRIESEEALSAWLVAMLNRIMDTIRRTSRRSHASVVRDILDFIHSRYVDPITRNDTAKAVHISPSLLSHILKQTTGRSFSEHLNQIRVDHAAELLRRTDLSLLQIALEVGYSDQSYFTKVFRRFTQLTPKAYRLQHQV